VKDDSSYLPNTQIVGVMNPESGYGPPIYNSKTGELSGPRNVQGITWWVKRRPTEFGVSKWREPFKVRILQLEPEGVLRTLKEEGKVAFRAASDRPGVISVELAKPPAWWRKYLP